MSFSCTRKGGFSVRAMLVAGVSSIGLIAGVAQASDIRGSVVAKADATALAGAIVTVKQTGATATTSQNGSFAFSGLPAGEYTLEVSYIGAAPKNVTVTVGESGVINQVIALSAKGEKDEILVFGQRSSINKALNEQRASDNLISVVSADAAGQFPDQNVSESVRRLVGMSVENDQGEGRYVVIRGIDPNLNGTSINGVRIPSPEGGDRKVALDVIDSDSLSSVEVTKSLTPDMDGDAIGGNVNIKTNSAFDRKGSFLKAKAMASYNDQADRWGEGVSAAGSTRWGQDGKFGIAGSVSYRVRDFATENKEVDDSEWKEKDGVWYPKELELRDYQVSRQRFNAALNLDWQVNANTHLFARSLYSDFVDQEERARVEVKIKDGWFDPAASDAGSQLAVFRAGEFGGDKYAISFDRDVKDRRESQTISSFMLGGETFSGPWTLNYEGSWSWSDEREPDRLDTTFRAKFKKDFSIGINSSNPLMPFLTFPDADSLSQYTDPDNYKYDATKHRDGISSDQEWATKFDAQRETQFGQYSGFIKAGAKLRWRHKKRNRDINIYDGFNGPDMLLTAFQSEVDYPLDVINPTVSRDGFRDFFFANQSDFELNENDTKQDSAAEDYFADENISAGYVMAHVDAGPTRVVAGLRVEHTSFSSEGIYVTVADKGSTYNGVVLADDEVFANPVMSNKSYTDWLPSINIRHELGKDMLIRAAYSRSIARPNISSAVPAADISQNDSDKLDAKLGNPDLNRQAADSFDLDFEKYFGESSAFTAGVFYKSLDDFIAKKGFKNLDYNGVTYDSATMRVNLDGASVWGVEVNYQQVFNFLPKPFDGLLVGVNYTHAEGEATLPDGRVIDLPKQSPNVANFVFGYDNGTFDARLALGYRDEYIDTVDEAGPGLDRIVRDHWQLDASARYQLLDHVALFAEAANLTNEPFIAVIRDGSQEFLSQYEEYSYSVKGGIKIKY